MVKVINENASHVLNILYANNHFELAITCDPMINSSNIRTHDAYDTKFKDHNINNENNEVQHKGNMFNWNFELNKNLLKIIKTHPKWLPLEIALTFIKKYTYLGLNTSQIKCHLNILNAYPKKIMIIKFIFFNKKNQKK
jgi:hypothetical protein